MIATMTLDAPLPALRALEVSPLRNSGGEIVFALIDQTRVAPRPVAVSIAGYLAACMLDGRRCGRDIQTELARRLGHDVEREELLHLVQILDENLLLATPRFESAYSAAVRRYLAAEQRDNRERWPDAAALREELERILAPGMAVAARPVRGIIAPHLDYARGAPCYADAYAALAAAGPADRYVILGTNHYGRRQATVATQKDFRTPLGLVPTDRGFLSRLSAKLGSVITDGEFDHAAEHSVELQVHMLQVIADDKPFEIVPVLCPDPTGPTGMRPADGVGVDLDAFARALAELLNDEQDQRRTVVIAGADMSHVGQRFGDSEPTTAEFLSAVARSDRALLDLLESHQEDQFVRNVTAGGNATRICSVGCIYALMRALPDCDFRVMNYHQAVDMAEERHVTCAAALLCG